MMKKTLVAAALTTLVGCSTFAPSKCDTQTCNTALAIASGLNDMAKDKTVFNDVIMLGGAVAEGPVVNVTMYLSGKNADLFQQAIANHPNMDKQLKQDMRTGVTAKSCDIPAFRQFVAQGGSIRYSINYMTTNQQYYEMEIESCPNA